MDPTQYVPVILQTIRLAYHDIKDQVRRDVRIQLGDSVRLRTRRDEVLRFITLINTHTDTIGWDEYNVMLGGAHAMIDCLDDALLRSEEPPDEEPPSLTELHYTGNRGRPQIEINPQILATSLEMRGPTALAEVFGCHPRTIRRRALEHQLVEPGEPVYIQVQHEDGSVSRLYRSSTRATSDISDDELDSIMAYLLLITPEHGRSMILGQIRAIGLDLTRARLQASYTRVHGAPASAFGVRRIARRVYHVRAPGCLWHHDGQHGLIRWRMVIHAFVDGYSRFVVGIRVSNNNRAQTVLDLFEAAVSVFGVPSRVCGDRGTENVRVAEYMEAVRGEDRGSYIYGRSVHNVRIERLWRDITMGFGGKWKLFLEGLEIHDNLDVNCDLHIWLVHFLFLPIINLDALHWAEGWNNHDLSQRDFHVESPRSLYFFGNLAAGNYNTAPLPPIVEDLPDADEEDIEAYGIDWEEMDHPDICRHQAGHNVDADANLTDVRATYTAHFNHVEVPNAVCPFHPDEVEDLRAQLLQLPFVNDRSMDAQRLVWINALNIVEQIIAMRGADEEDEEGDDDGSDDGSDGVEEENTAP